MPAIVGRTRLVGREQELTRLRERLDAARKGEGGVVLVAGEPGIGKTRLLGELTAQARGAGCRVLWGSAYETEGMPPYLPFSEALREYVRSCPLDDLQTQLGDGAADVALISPEVGRRLPGLAPSPSTSPEYDRYRLFESVCDLLLAIAREGALPDPRPSSLGRKGETARETNRLLRPACC